MQNLITKVMTAALMRSSCVQTFPSSAGWWTVHLVSDVFLSSDGKLFHTDRPAVEKLQEPKPTVLFLGVAKQTADAITRVSSDVRYTGVSWCKHLYLSRQILKSLATDFSVYCPTDISHGLMQIFMAARCFDW